METGGGREDLSFGLAYSGRYRAISWMSWALEFFSWEQLEEAVRSG